jgi:squalene-hopene/tetraprenyl-beta-curcumene cyclase
LNPTLRDRYTFPLPEYGKAGVRTVAHAITHAPAQPISDRDAAWLEELADAVARGRAALLVGSSRPSSACDAALSLVALAEAGEPADSAACESLAQRLTCACPPAASEAAAVLTALARSGHALRAPCANTVYDALQLLLDLQHRDGGWPSAKGGSSCPAATGRGLEARGHFGFRTGQAPVAAAVRFLLARQDGGGAWDGPADALAGLRSVGFDAFAMPVRRALRWLKDSQSADGGWGAGESTAAATAGALLALVTANEVEGPEARAGAEYLVGTQRADGTWRDERAGVLPLLALARYARSQG